MARCQWCTAPLPAGRSVCRYCGKRSDIDLRGVHEFTVATPESARICPACEIPMQTLDLNLGGMFLIERCEKCLSLFFDPNEIETVLEKSTSEVFQIDRTRLGELDGVRGREFKKYRYFKCPVCRTAMNRVNFGARSGVVVDQCHAHGMWLESGELRRLLEWKQAGGQILDRRRNDERREEARKEERRRARETPRPDGESGGGLFDQPVGGPLAALPDLADSVNQFVGLVLKLFR